MEDIFFGLDFGTTNSAIAVNKAGKVEVIKADKLNINGKTLRSVIYFNEERQVFTGQQAINEYINDYAEGRFMQSIKSFLPNKTFQSTVIYKKVLYLEDLIAIILKKIKEVGEEYVNSSVDTVVIGRPVIFSKNLDMDALAESRLKEAAKKSGFKNISFQYEPVAAGFSIENILRKGEEKIVLVGDFGGGTSDFSIIKLKGGEKKYTRKDRKNDILALGGVCIGGDVFDSQIMWEKIAKYFGKEVKIKNMTGKWLGLGELVTVNLRQWHLISRLKDIAIMEYISQSKITANTREVLENLEDLIENNYGFMIFQAIEKAKIELSYQMQSKISFDMSNLSIQEGISKSEFNIIIEEEINKINQCIDELLFQAQLKPDKIDLVFNTGGSSFIPFVRQIFIDKFCESKIITGDAFTSVAYGLGN